MKVLAVEDDPVAQLVLEASLRSLGHEVTVLADGAAAWEALQATDGPRVVVSDWMLPGIDGLELCRRVRSAKRDYVYFILLSQRSASDENHEAALAAGVDDFLSKPVDLRELRMRLRVAERIIDYTRQVRQLESFLPICSYCKNVRDDKNYWQRIETFLHARTGTNFSHGVCPECYESQIRPMLTAEGMEAPPYEEMLRRR